MPGSEESEAEGRRVVRALQLSHRCVSGCPGCDEADSFALERLEDFERYVVSEAALRAAEHARRANRPFPTVSRDDVVQFCVEEAVFKRLEIRDELAKVEALGEEIGLDPSENAGEAQAGPTPVWRDPALERARAFARGEEPV